MLVNEADSRSPSLPEKVHEQTAIMRRQVTFYLDRARAAARARTIGVLTEVKPVVEGLVRTFEKLHAERGLAFSIELPDGLRFRGEAQDLTDLIGNLLDNAGKWARERVAIRAWREAGPRDAASFLIAEIDDDGPGLDEGARARLRSLCATSVDAEGRLIVVSQVTRDQRRNLEDARDKVRVLVERAPPA